MSAEPITVPGYAIVQPAADPASQPKVEEFRSGQLDAESRATALSYAYSPERYPNGLVVVPCTIILELPAKP